MNTSNAIVQAMLLAGMAIGLATVAGVPTPAGAAMLTDSTATALAAALIIQSAPGRTLSDWLRLAGTAAVVALALMAWHTGLARPGSMLGLALGVAVLTLFTGAVARLAAVTSGTLARWLPVTLLIVAATLPFWAAALVGTVGADALVGISPLSYLAAMADYDYLRSNVGYRYSTISGLRYAYPDPGIYTVGLAVVTIGLGAAARQRSARAVIDHSSEGEPEQ